MASDADRHIHAAEKILNEDLDYHFDDDREKARIQIAEAQVHATKAVAAAVDRLAQALENLRIGN